MNRKLILGIDFNNMLIGSYYGEKLINSKGVNVNAIKGFFFKLKSLKDSLEPDYIVFGNDIGRDKTFRRKLYKPYKAQRKGIDIDIVNQLKYASHIASLLGYPIINNELYEADDILGMVSKYATENDMDMIISSTDKDLYQLVNDRVYIFSHRNKDMVDIDWIYEKYKLTPEQWIDLKILMGDPSDNIPGIDGIGEITGLRLLHEYQTLDNVYQHLHCLKPALRDSLNRGLERLPLIRELVTIITDYNVIDFKPSMLENTGVFEDELYNILGELELNSLFNVVKYSLLTMKNQNQVA